MYKNRIPYRSLMGIKVIHILIYIEYTVDFVKVSQKYALMHEREP